MPRVFGGPSSERDGGGGEPDRRALDAMASAARRAQGTRAPVDTGTEETGARRLIARSSTAGVSGSPGPRGQIGAPDRRVQRDPVHRDPVYPALVRDDGLGAKAATGDRGDWRSRWGLDARRARTLLLTGLVGVLVIAGAGIALGIALRSPARPATSPARTARTARRPVASQRGTVSHKSGGGTRTGTGTTHTHGTHAGSATTRPSTPSTSTSPSTSTPPSTSTSPSAGGGPRLASASPSAGGPGQTVVVDGSGLYSANGHVVVYFGATAAPTRCTSQSSCTVTVPDLGGGPSTVRLTILTSSGRSNRLTFSYR